MPGRPPDGAVELVEVLDLPVRRAPRVDAQHLGALARPVERPVGVAPVEGHRRAGPELLGPGAVVEPRAVAVGGGRERDRAHDDDAEHGEADPGAARQPLEPEEADGERGERRAEQHLVGAADRHDRRGDHDEQRREREEQVPAAVLARPEGEQRREHAEHRAEQLERQRGPGVRGLVGQGDGAERLGAAPQPGHEVVPLARLEQVQREPGGGVRAEQARQRRAERQRRRPARPGARPQHRERAEDADDDPEDCPADGEPGDQALPLHDAQQRERGVGHEACDVRRHHRRRRGGGRPHPPKDGRQPKGAMRRLESWSRSS